jgi:hypothetical protein
MASSPKIVRLACAGMRCKQGASIASSCASLNVKQFTAHSADCTATEYSITVTANLTAIGLVHPVQHKPQVQMGSVSAPVAGIEIVNRVLITVCSAWLQKNMYIGSMFEGKRAYLLMLV